MVSELLRWSLLESLRLPEAKQWLHHCDSLRPGPSREFATLSAMGIQAYQLRPRSAEILQATGIKLAQCYFLSPRQNVYLIKLFSSHFAKTVQIRIFYSVLYSGILLLPWLPFKNTDSLFTFPSASRTPVTTRKAWAMLSNKQSLLTEERKHVDKESKWERADQTHIYWQLTDLLSKINSHIYWYLSLACWNDCAWKVKHLIE